jgi:hypothetical protein
VVEPVTKININGANHQVEIDHDSADLSYVVEKAQKLWNDTKPTDAKPGPAIGYSMQMSAQQSGPQSFRHKDQPVVDR